MKRIMIGKGSCGIAAGAVKIEEIFKGALDPANVPVTITGCIGMCFLEPIVDVFDGTGVRTTYVRVDDAAALEIIKSLNNEDNCASDHEISEQEKSFLLKQTRVVLRNCGNIDPESISDYIKTGGYEAVRKCLLNYSPDDVINEIKASGLGGRGGAGFPTGLKWQFARDSRGDKKYLICNADEGDPGAFMDRAVIEGDPHSIIEGMLIAAYAIGADEGIIYVRAEYPLAILRMEKALGDALRKSYIGSKVFGSDFSFNLRIIAGAGAFVCGEETALIASLEGERGMPRLKPPFPAQKGYWQKPSNINNVETFANVAWIINNGGAKFAGMGTENSRGTKVFALTGKINNGGLVEIPMGMTLRDVIEGIGGGIRNGKKFKAVQMGGPSGGCLPFSLIGTVIDYKALASTGAIMGSGGMVILDEDTCMVDIARYFLDFTCRESCGKCAHCRIGTKRLLEILERIVDGKGRENDIGLLSELALQIKEGALCQLGMTAPNPVLTTLKYFENEYTDHIKNRKCTARQCRALVTYNIISDKCSGCTLCKRNCPVSAISGEAKKPHAIDGGLCVKCGKCGEVCRFHAVIKS